MNKPPLPRYEALKTFVCERIESGEWAPNDRIPSETTLAEDFGVSRMTANRAIRELTAEGRLTRIPGVGTFVLAPKVRGTIVEIRSISQEIAARGHTHSSRLLSLEKIRASSRIARVLEVDEASLVFNAVIVHLEDGEPVQLENRYVNPAAAPDFLELDFRNKTPSDYLLGRLPVAEIEQTIEARLPSPDEAEHLNMDLSEPCLVLERRSRTGRMVVTYVRLVHPGHKVTLGGLTGFASGAQSFAREESL
ncbi:histidine utilization repressor [Martelella endophytica]|uniref:histidine utilization repressor n=1 Tax=Martelella endophytica TaxID=1486262 RepID=UPI0005F22ABF|nr:histidine utilization repressor [Martelella endophytica]